MTSKLHFTSDTPPEALINDVKSLMKFQEEQFSELAVSLISYLVRPSQTQLISEEIERFAEKYSFDLNQLKPVVKSLLTVLKGCRKAELEAPLVKEDLIRLGLDENKAERIAQLWKDNMSSATETTPSQTLSLNKLVDIEWKFGVTAASSELNKIGNTFLQVKLVIDKGHKTEDVFMELTLPQFYSFLHELERAKSSLEFLT